MLDLSERDHNTMDEYLKRVLRDYADGNVTEATAVGDLAHAITLAAKDQDLMSYVRACLETERT